MKESFFPRWLGVIVNPFYFARHGLAEAMRTYSKLLNGKLLDVGCGTKPYSSLFDVDEYVGLDIDSESSRKRGIADFFMMETYSHSQTTSSTPLYAIKCSNMFLILIFFYVRLIV